MHAEHSQLEVIEELARASVSNPMSPRVAMRVIEELPKLPGPWRDQWMASCNGIRKTIRHIEYVGFLGRRLVEGHTIASALTQLQATLDTPRAAGAFLLGVSGPIVPQRIDIAEGLSLVPGGAFPERHATVDGAFFPHQVTACVRGEVAHEAPFCKGQPVPPEAPALLAPNPCAALYALQSLLALFTFPSPISSQGFVFTYDDASVEELADTGSIRTPVVGQLPLYSMPMGAEIRREDIVSAWAGFNKLDDGARARVLTACDRMNRALLQVGARPVDACIEACIALEALFGGKQSDSLTHKLATRCARFMETTVEKRAEAARFVKQAYAFRSKGVHGSVGKDALSIKDLQGLCELVALAARRIVTTGIMPSDDALDFSP